MSNLASLFNPKSLEQPTRNTDEYKVSFKEGKGGIYESVIRFIPWVNDVNKSLMSKQVSFVKNPITQKGMYMDDPRTVGEFSPILDMFFKCYNSGNAQIKEFGKQYLSTKEQHTCLVQIIKDDQHPDLVGKIKVFKFGKKLWEKLYNEEHPAMGNGVNPFHPIYGRYFYIKCISQSGFNNFDQSYFFDNKNQQAQILPSGFFYEDPSAPGRLQPVTEQSNQQAVADYLAANSPDLSRYDYTPWTPEQRKHADETLAIMANYLQGGGNMQIAMQTLNNAGGQAAGGATMQMNANPVFPGATMPTATQQAPQSMPQMPQPTMPMSTQPAQTMPSTPNVSSPSMEGLSIGGATIPGMTPAAPTIPSVSGVDIPNVEAPNVGFNTGGVGIGGNLDDVIAQL